VVMQSCLFVSATRTGGPAYLGEKDGRSPAEDLRQGEDFFGGYLHELSTAHSP
jgi:hypothetical protein